MRIGKPEESVNKRINKYLKPYQDELVTIIKQTVINYDFAANTALIGAFNELCSLPAKPAYITIGLIMPLDAKPQDATAIMEQLSKISEKKAVPITNINVTARAVNRAILTVCLTGKKDSTDFIKESDEKKSGIDADVVIAGYVAGLGTAVMADLKKDRLKEVFAEPFIKGASGFKEHLDIFKIVQVAFLEGAEYVLPFSEGGIFAGLWDLAEKLKSGLSIDLKKIPIKQETIELSEVLKINPYLTDSTGAVMIVTKNGEELVRKLAGEGISATLAGTLNKGNDKVLLNDGEARYIDRPQIDEIYKLFEEE